ncbi:AAA family ATPase [Gordonia polyisoprenivorans VH2]|uniref:AAA family ATPase n=1 Tax=Gordonia polyisoprenivorans (strain DSM 44266 / VH2) TaxID=1112204 RepID=H6MYP0_GORPV|nr:AAA family ATPase [Gordonia polyisoprenivorans]AFA71918.1 AAA family ATPase [Gordonia polyisoprenivorans VH2]WCB38296.1 AAA family ATPase [Gordonia polyisoprenivorans]
MSAQLTLTARLNPSAGDARRGIVRVHPEALTALGLREWDAVRITGARVSAAVVAAAPADSSTGTILLDDISFSNTGVRENAAVVVEPVQVQAATRVTVTGSALASQGVDAPTLRRALLGKVLSVGDTVSLLPRDLGPELTASEAVRTLARSVGITWTTQLLTVTATEPGAPVSVQPNTAVMWTDTTAPSAAGAVTGAVGAVTGAVGAGTGAVGGVTGTVRPVAELVGVDDQVAKLTEWLRITLDQPEVLRTLGAVPRLGVLLTGPAGVGKATLVRAVADGRPLAVIDGPTVGATEANSRLRTVTDAVSSLRPGGGVLLITDVDALLPAEAEPVSTLLLDTLREALAGKDDQPGTIALIATTTQPAAVDTRLRDPQLCDRELSIGLPDAALRGRLLAAILTGVPTEGDLQLSEIASRTPGFVAGDLAALTREAALRAAARVTAAGSTAAPALTAEDLRGAVGVIRPVSRATSPEVSLGSITLDDVGDMVETRQALTEAVLWPLEHPDTFTRLGVDPPRGVLLYGPPGCGKTFVVRALAASGRLSVHTVKGAELMDKWVGASERAVRDLFDRARESAPSLIFLDEVDALAPRRGQSSDSGVSDRVVAALLTELDGVEPLADVVVLGATNRPDLIDPALLRPGRLERLVFVPPPDAQARADILRTSGRNVPLADDVDIESLATDLEGYSAADCSALLREAALSAMRRNIEAATVTADDVADARTRVRPSLDAAQVENLRAYAQRRSQ